MKYLIFAALLSACAPARAEAFGCPPAGYDRAKLEALNAAHWEINDAAARNALARALVACLADPNPHLRDELAFTGLQYWMRSNALTTETVSAIGDELQNWLTAPDAGGFRRPFAALVLADVARTDRLHPWMTPARRQSLLDAAINYFVNIRDYRGFDDHDGWRHGIAHGSDLLMQLALNPALGKPELERVRDAVARQISPPGHFYIYGEADRLANPILYIAGRGVFTEAEWTAWFAQIASPAPLASWRDAYAHNVDLARVHNLSAFLRAVFSVASLDDAPADDVLLPGAKAALRGIP
jgi:hypothetical protein